MNYPRFSMLPPSFSFTRSRAWIPTIFFRVRWSTRIPSYPSTTLTTFWFCYTPSRVYLSLKFYENNIAAFNWCCSSWALIKLLIMAATSNGVSWNLLPLDSMSSFLLRTFSPMASSACSWESQPSYPSWVLITEPPLTYQTALTWNTALECDYESANVLITQMLDE